MRSTTFLTKNYIFMPVVALIAAIISFSGMQALASGTSQVTCEDIEETCVSLISNRISPDELAIKVGSYVHFNTEDGKKHSISIGDGIDDHKAHGTNQSHDHTDEFSSGDFGKGEAWRVQFKQKGTYKLHDHYNPEQRILVVVY